MTKTKTPISTAPAAGRAPFTALPLALVAAAAALAAKPVPATAEDAAAPTAEEVAFFEKKIRPALADYCYKCHSNEEKVRGGLTLDTREGLRAGGDSGSAVAPGDPGSSLLYAAITWADEDLEMPPKQKLPPAVIADFRRWIEMGAPDPRVTEKAVLRSEIDIEAGRSFWSFQKPVKPAPPTVRGTPWPASDIDRFVLARLEKNGLKPSAEAAPAALLRRLSFDLVGLPPSPEEVADFLAAWEEDAAAAYAAAVDRLLASKGFGERWGRHWLDVARYAESSGKEVNVTFPHAWRYRDYVIDSFNADKPYDRFVREQIAGDLLPVETDEQWQENLVATGFLAVGPKGLNERNPRQFALDLADEQLDTTAQAVLGLTIACARCHDHKSDPVPTADYYALSGIFQSTRTYYGTVQAIVNRRGSKLLQLPLADAEPLATYSPDEVERLRSRLEDTQEQLRELQVASRRDRRGGDDAGPPPNFQNILRLRNTVFQLQARLDGVGPGGEALTLAMGAQDWPRPVEPVVLVRGELDKPAQDVERGFLQVLDHPGTPRDLPAGGSGRLQLAQWLTSPQNPLTARVMVNRVWGHLTGRGIVASPDNFGATGQRPSHPELLDHLAVRFVELGWSIKSIVREIVLSRTYRQATTFNAQAYAADPENTLLWRATPRRLDAEALRDAMLAASGQLDRQRPLGSLVADVGDAFVGRRFGTDTFNRPVNYRSVYLPAVRDALPEALALFDAADPNRVAGTREETNVPGQALYLLNNPTVIAQAEAMARRVRDGAKSAREQVTCAFLLAFGRPPTRGEIAAATDFFKRFKSAPKTSAPSANADSAGPFRRRGFFQPDRERERDRRFFPRFRNRGNDGPAQGSTDALTAFCQALFASAEFRYLE